jgi:CelD/BcsL family acetyltransferase involved in cellulose biosynthesis
MPQLEMDPAGLTQTVLRGELERGPRTHGNLDVSLRPLPLISASEITDWQSLARQAAEPNPFQEPEFVLALADSGVVSESLHVLAVKDVAARRWLAACVFQACPPTLTRPLPHLRSLCSRYSFLDSPLVHREHVPAALRAALAYLQQQRSWHGARFRIQRSGGDQAAEWSRQARQLGLAVDHDSVWQRAATSLTAVRAESLLARCSRSRRKSLTRARRWLESLGPVSHRLISPADSRDPTCSDFLTLEALGWKGAHGTAIASQQADVRFFQMMVDRFAAERRIVFSELRVGGQLVASTCNLVSGTTVFAFKLGWNPEYARGNPGHWAEIELASSLSRERTDLLKIDSCSQEGSYVESVYTQTQAMESATCVWSRRATALCEIRRQIRSIRRGWGAATPAPGASESTA